jgi:hypothetical protein
VFELFCEYPVKPEAQTGQEKHNYEHQMYVRDRKVSKWSYRRNIVIVTTISNFELYRSAIIPKTLHMYTCSTCVYLQLASFFFTQRRRRPNTCRDQVIADRKTLSLGRVTPPLASK